MRYLVKFVILVAIVFGFMTVYGLFDFHYGFANGLGEINELEILASDNVKYLVINDDTMYVTMVYNNRLYAGLLTSSDADIIAAVQQLKGSSVQLLSYVWAIVFGLGFIVTLFFQKERKKLSLRTTYLLFVQVGVH